ncbi:MAG TPA: histidinol-phosphate transaminase [Anaerolineaceae bacterium]
MKFTPKFADLPPYTPIEPFEVVSARLGRNADEIIKLDANENPYGASPRVLEALANLAYPHIYPDPESRALRAALQDFTGVPAEYLMASAGSDELINLVIQVMVNPGEAVIDCPPTFLMYGFDTRLNLGKVVQVPRRPNFGLDLPAIQKTVEQEQPKVLVIAAPNNPDGSLPTQEEIDALLDLPVLVILDEAYIEFTPEGGRLGEMATRINQVPARENLIVLRTFSKWAGLAGMRVGYGAFPSWLMPTLWKSKQPYNVSVAASTAAIASLQDLETLADRVARIKADRSRLFGMLQSVPYLTPYPSQTNFILCQVNDRPAVELKSQLAKAGILVRHYNTSYLKNYIRITVGKPGECDRLIQVLHDLEKEAG